MVHDVIVAREHVDHDIRRVALSFGAQPQQGLVRAIAGYSPVDYLSGRECRLQSRGEDLRVLNAEAPSKRVSDDQHPADGRGLLELDLPTAQSLRIDRDLDLEIAVVES